MFNISNFIIPIIIFIVIIYGLIKKVDIYNSFIQGVKEGLKITIELFPTIFAMILSISIIVKSTFLIDISNIFKPLLNMINFPSEILPLAILRPISGSSSLLYLNSLYDMYGVDSFIGRIASIIQSGTDTTIYILGLYYGSIQIKKIRHSLIVGLLTDLCCVVLSVFVVMLYFN